VPPTLLQPWENAQRAYRVMEQRQSWRALGAHEGLLAAPDLQADLARRYGPDHTWSFSRLGNYGTCPYLFFARDVLDLKPLPDPEAGLDHMQLGSLYHALLEKLYQRLTGEALTPAPSTKDAVLDRLDAACREAFPTAPARYGFRPGDLWEYEQQEMRRVLSAFMTWECDKNNNAARWQPYLQEWHFGMPGGDQPRLWVDGAFYLHGVVDRLDRDDQGRLRLVDYKSGSTAKTGTEVDEGRALQTVLYTLAARELAGSSGVAESLYLHIPSRKSGGALTFPGDEGRLEAAVATAVAFVRQVRAGRFPAAPGDKACSKTCEMHALCRRTRQSIAKVRRSENP
jgi:ATP-dependent helicase/nuclease subunit B